MTERERRRLEAMTPEPRAKAESARAHFRRPEVLAANEKARAAIEEEVAATGGITTGGGVFHTVKAPSEDAVFSLVTLGAALRERRQAAGKTLETLADESGMDQGLLSRIERGVAPNPTVGTLARVAAALGARITIGVEAADRP